MGQPNSVLARLEVIRALMAAIEAQLDEISITPVSDTRVYLHDQLWRKHNGVCPECGVNWDLPSPECPRVQFNRHPVG